MEELLIIIIITWLFLFSISQAAKEKKLLELCYDGTADIRDFLSLLAEGVDPDIYDEVGATALAIDKYLC